MMPNLMPSLKLILTTAAVVLLSGCFEERITIQVNKQGSGVVSHHSYNNAQDLMSSMLGGLGGAENDAAGSKTEYNDAFFADKAKQMGDGVSVKSWKRATNNAGFKGYEAEYAFSDINTLSVQASPVSDQQAGDKANIDSSALEAEHYFSMADGKLIIHTPEPASDKDQSNMADQANNAATQQMLAMMGAMFRGARVSIDVEALDEIKSSNAHHRNGNRVTIMDVRLDELMSDPKLFTEAQKFNTLDRAEAQALADKINGIDVDTQAEIILQF